VILSSGTGKEGRQRRVRIGMVRLVISHHLDPDEEMQGDSLETKGS